MRRFSFLEGIEKLAANLAAGNVPGVNSFRLRKKLTLAPPTIPGIKKPGIGGGIKGAKVSPQLGYDNTMAYMRKSLNPKK